MISAVQAKPRSFFDILFTPLGKKVFAVLLLGAIITIATAWWMVSVAPQDYSGTGDPYGADIDVPFSSEQPITIRVSHDFHLVMMKGALFFGYFTVDGEDPVNYTLNITNSNGDLVETISGQMSAPETYPFDRTSRDAVATVQHEKRVRLEPGKYTLTFSRGPVFRYAVEQESTFGVPSTSLGLLGVIFILAIFGDLLVAFKAWERENRTVVMVPVAALPPTSPAYYRTGPAYYPPAAAYYPPAPVYYPPAVTLPYQDSSYSPPPPSQVPPESEVIGYLCGKCGHEIQNPVVNNAITCEKCGEIEYVGQYPGVN